MNALYPENFILTPYEINNLDHNLARAKSIFENGKKDLRARIPSKHDGRIFSGLRYHSKEFNPSPTKISDSPKATSQKHTVTFFTSSDSELVTAGQLTWIQRVVMSV